MMNRTHNGHVNCNWCAAGQFWSSVHFAILERTPSSAITQLISQRTPYNRFTWHWEHITPIPTDDWFAFNSIRTLQSPFYTLIHCSFHHKNRCGAHSTHSTIYILRIYCKFCVRERHSPSSNRLTWQPTVFHTFACAGTNHAHTCFSLLLVDTATSSDTDFVSNGTESYSRAT